MDNETIKRTPIPKAASTRLIDKRLKSLKLSNESSIPNLSLRSSEGSSLGIISDISGRNNSWDLDDPLPKAFSKRSSSIRASDGQSPYYANLEEGERSSDDVFASFSPQVLNEPGTTDQNNRSQSQSISDLSNIEFVLQHISARSSIADVGEANAGKASKTTENKSLSASVAMANIFRRHTLDVSAYIQPQTVSEITNSNSLNANNYLAASNSKGLIDSGGSDSDRDLNLFHKFQVKAPIEESDSFIPGDQCLNLLEKDEAQFENEHKFSIAVETEVKNDKEVEVDGNWLNNLDTQNITRPSWMTSSDEELGSRVSIGKLFAARTGSIDSTMDVMFNVNEPRTFTVENARSNKIKNQNGSHQNNSAFVENEIDNSSDHNDISDVLESASLNDDTKILAEKMYMALTKSSLPAVRSSNRGGFSKAAKVSSVSLLTPIPSVSEAPSPMPSEYAQKMDKSIQTSIEKTRTIESTISSNENIFQSSSCNFLKQYTASASSNPISVTTMLPERARFVPLVENTNNQPSASNLVSSDLQCQNITNLPDTQNKLRSSSHLSRLQSCSKNAEVELPSTIQFDLGCVGISNESSVVMRNINCHWLEGTYKFVSLTRDGQTWPSNNVQVFKVPQIWHLQPKSTQCLQVIFCPPQKGCWEARLQFYFRVYKQFNKCEKKQKGDKHMKWDLSSVVTFKGMAEKPNLILSPKDKVDFRIVTEESLHIERLRIKNGGLAKFPIKISIKEVCGKDAGYYFPVESGSATLSDFFTKRVSLEKNSELDVQIAFKAPKIDSSVSEKYFDVFSAELQIELDGIGPNPILGSIPLSATVGSVRLYVHLENEVIQLNASNHNSHTFSLHNQGGVPLNLLLYVDDSEEVSVIPNELTLVPEDQRDIQIMYHPKDFKNSISSSLKIKICPEGPIFAIPVEGFPTVIQQYPLLKNHDGTNIGSDRSEVIWKSLAIGRKKVERLVLRNKSSTETLNLNLNIKANNLLESVFSFWEHNSSKLRTFLKLLPGQQSEIYLKFMPSSNSTYRAWLVVKPQQPYENTYFTGAWLKYTVPLVGYGGTSSLKLLGIQKEQPSHGNNEMQNQISTTDYTAKIDLNGLINHLPLKVKNDGERAGYLGVTCSLGNGSIEPLPAWMSVQVQPPFFLVVPGAQMTLNISVSNSDLQKVCNFYLLIGSMDDVLWRRCMVLRQNGLLSRATAHFMEKVFFDQPNASSALGDGSSEVISLPSQDDYNRLLSSVQLHRVKVHCMTRSDSNASLQSSNRNFVTLPPEMTFTEATFMERAGNDCRMGTFTSAPEYEPMEPTNDSWIQIDTTNVIFPETKVNDESCYKLKVKNRGLRDYKISLSFPKEPFHIKVNSVVIQSRHYTSLPVYFNPTSNGVFKSDFRIISVEEDAFPSFFISIQGNSY